MVNRQTIAGNWNEVRGKLKQKWGQLTDDELRTFNGSVEQLVGQIQRKTGESREIVEEFLEEISETGSHFVSDISERLEEGAATIAEGARQGVEALRHGYEEAERVVQERPAQSLAVAFGLGFVSGIVLTLLLRERSDVSMLGRGRSAAHHFGRHAADTMAELLPESLKKNFRG